MIAIFSDGDIVHLGYKGSEAERHFVSKEGNVWAEVKDLNEAALVQEHLKQGKPASESPCFTKVYHSITLDEIFNQVRTEFSQTMADLGITPETAEHAVRKMEETAKELVGELHDAGKKGLRVIGAGFHVVGQVFQKLSED